jgi:hypothetical protein
MGYVRPSLVYLRSFSAVSREFSTPSLHLNTSSRKTMSASGILPAVRTVGCRRAAQTGPCGSLPFCREALNLSSKALIAAICR